MRKRTLARECALKVLYQRDVRTGAIESLLEQYWQTEEETEAEVKDFTRRLVFGIDRHRDVIDAKICQYATNWQLKRMAIIDRNILRLGVFELLHTTDIPPKVTINEAVELAKKYGDLESGKFVNGILDKINKSEKDISQKAS